MLWHSGEFNGSSVKADYDASAQIGPLSTEPPLSERLSKAEA